MSQNDALERISGWKRCLHNTLFSVLVSRKKLMADRETTDAGSGLKRQVPGIGYRRSRVLRSLAVLGASF